MNRTSLFRRRFWTLAGLAAGLAGRIVPSMAERFYINCSLQPGPVSLQGAEAHHLAGVRRVQLGEEVCLFNGDGHEYLARVISTNRKETVLEVTSSANISRELPFCLHAAVPLPKGDRAQVLIEKLTELGVTTFTPLITTRSIILPRAAKLDKLRRWVIEASKQCGRNVLMTIEQPCEWKDFCRQNETQSIKLIAHPEKDADGFASLPRLGNGTGVALRFVIGPEGGFTDEEAALAEQHGWRKVNLGSRIMRVETAAITLAAYLNCIAK